MTDKDIRAMLRGGVKSGLLDGWYWHGEPDGPSMRYVVNPQSHVVSTFTPDEAKGFCCMLSEAGVEPLYRSH